MNFSGGTFNGTGAATVSTAFNWSGSGQTLLGVGTLTANGATTITGAGNKVLTGSTVLTIAGAGGTWDIVMQSRKDPCIGRKYPITVEKVTADELTFTVNRAATLAGCRDSTYTFKKVDDTTLKGELADGRAASMTRK